MSVAEHSELVDVAIGLVPVAFAGVLTASSRGKAGADPGPRLLAERTE